MMRVARKLLATCTELMAPVSRRACGGTGRLRLPALPHDAAQGFAAGTLFSLRPISSAPALALAALAAVFVLTLAPAASDRDREST